MQLYGWNECLHMSSLIQPQKGVLEVCLHSRQHFGLLEVHRMSSRVFPRHELINIDNLNLRQLMDHRGS